MGKSTLVNSLSGSELVETGSIRDQDGKGRHTTSYRSLHRLSGGGLLLDVPGMRELKVAELETRLAITMDLSLRLFKYIEERHKEEEKDGIRVPVLKKPTGSNDEFLYSYYNSGLKVQIGDTISNQWERQEQVQTAFKFFEDQTYNPLVNW